MKRLIALAAIVAAMATAALVGGVSVAQATPTCSYGTGAMQAPGVFAGNGVQDATWWAPHNLRGISCNFNWNVRIQFQKYQNPSGWTNVTSCVNGPCSLHLPVSGGCNGGNDVCQGGVASFANFEFEKTCSGIPPWDSGYRAHIAIYEADGSPVDDYYTNSTPVQLAC